MDNEKAKFRVLLFNKRNPNESPYWTTHSAVDSKTAIDYFRGQGFDVIDIEDHETDEGFFENLDEVLDSLGKCGN